MSVSNRAAIFANLHKVLVKHYKPFPSVERPLLEQLLFACFLEDSKPEVAQECFARMQESFFDWNEVRVTTVRELTELMKGLTDASRTATALKQTLHSVFEAIYNYDLEPLKKQNQGVSVKQLQQFRGTTPFTVAYVVQHGLGGHQIPVSPAGLEVMLAIGAITEAEFNEGTVPGLERAIPKNKGVEFASLFQQLAAEFAANPNATHVKSVLLEIDPESKARIAKRNQRKAEAEAAAAAKLAAEKAKADQEKAEKVREKNEKIAEKARKEKEKAAKEAAKEASARAAKEAEKKKEADKKEADKREKKEAEKRENEKRKEAEKREAEKRKEAEKKAAAALKKPSQGKDKKSAASGTAKSVKKPVPKAAAKKTSPNVKKPAKKSAPKKPSKTIAKKAVPTGKKSTSKQLARRKPR